MEDIEQQEDPVAVAMEAEREEKRAASVVTAQRYAFCDPGTGMLKTHGFVDSNEDGDFRVEVDEDFAEVPRTVAYDKKKKTWVEYAPE